MRPVTAIPVTVYPDDGDPVEIVLGGRELARWETQPFGNNSLNALSTTPVAFLRFCAWAYLTRTGATREAYETWSAKISDVKLGGADDEDTGRGPDPTRSAPNGEADSS